jgi:hypothetical protein
MKTIKWIPLVVTVVFACTEQKSNPVVAQEDYSSLLQSWTHSFEEQTDSVQIFRPTNSRQFLMSRFRQIYEFSKDSSCKYLVLNPNDTQYLQSGKWTIISHSDRILAIFDTTGNLERKFKIVELQQDLLRFVDLY